jgi:Regulator of Vps4 activity in the MVB pathway
MLPFKVHFASNTNRLRRSLRVSTAVHCCKLSFWGIRVMNLSSSSCTMPMLMYMRRMLTAVAVVHLHSSSCYPMYTCNCHFIILKLLNVSLLSQMYTTLYHCTTLSQQDNCVHDKVITKLSVEPPTSELVQNYLIEIAAASNIDWKPRVNLAKLWVL